jgi:hypothetical protein
MCLDDCRWAVSAAVGCPGEQQARARKSKCHDVGMKANAEAFI